MGTLFRFHGSLEYGFIGCVSRVGIALFDALKKNQRFSTFPPLFADSPKNNLPSVRGGMYISTVLNFDRFVR